MARARRQVQRSNRPARGVEWARGFTVQTTVIGAAGASSAAAFDISAVFPFIAAAVSPTIVRIRGCLVIGADLTAGIGMWSAGFVKVSAKAFGVGITAIPIPAVDDADWQWYMACGIGDAAAIATSQPANDMSIVEIDSKSMRRYEQDDEHLVFVFANNTGIAGDDISFRLGFSILVKE